MTRSVWSPWKRFASLPGLVVVTFVQRPRRTGRQAESDSTESSFTGFIFDRWISTVVVTNFFQTREIAMIGELRPGEISS